MGLTGHKNTGGGMPGPKSKSLGFNMKGSPYSMNQPLHGNAFIGAKVKAEEQGKNSFDVGGETFPVKKSEGPKFVGALLAGAGKFLAKKALPAIVKAGAGVAKTAASGVGEGLSGVAAGLKDKVGGGGKGAFKEKVGNYIKSLDLITNSNPDGSIRKDGPSTAADSDQNIANTEVDLGETGAKARGDGSVGEDLKMPNLAIDKSAIPNQQDTNKGIIGGKDYSKGLAPLNKLKNMCRR